MRKYLTTSEQQMQKIIGWISLRALAGAAIDHPGWDY
jgi:hypothetical protein